MNAFNFLKTYMVRTAQEIIPIGDGARVSPKVHSTFSETSKAAFSVIAKSLHVPAEMEKSFDLYEILDRYFICKPYSSLETCDLAISGYLKFWREQAQDYAKRMTELCTLFGITLTEKEYENEVEKYLILVVNDRVIPELKLSLNIVFCSFYKVEMPPFDPIANYGLKLFPRRFRQLLKSYISRINHPLKCLTAKFSRTREYLINTLFQGYKRGLLPSSPRMVEQSLIKNRDALTSDGTIDNDLMQDAKRICKNLVQGLTPGTVDDYINGLNKTSRSSNLFSPYAHYGTLGKANPRSIETLLPSEKTGEKMWEMTPDGKGKKVDIGEPFKEATDHLQPRDLIGYTYPEEEYNGKKRTLWYKPVPVYHLDGIYPNITDLYSEAKILLFESLEIHDDCSCDPEDGDVCTHPKTQVRDPNLYPVSCLVTRACIQEPLKTRIITKPRPFLHSGMYWIQKKMWSYLRTIPCFALIGEEISMDHVKSIWNKEKGNWISGDYSAATDNLKSDLSLLIFDAVAEKIYPGFDFTKVKEKEFVDPMELSLYNARVSLCSNFILDDEHFEVLPHYDEESPYFQYQFRHRSDPSSQMGGFQQRNGQLMGNVISFPILCMANYILYHRSVEQTLKKEMNVENVLNNYPSLINGDDILFQLITNDLTVNQYEIWKKVVTDGGLCPSMGKNFSSSDFCMINSRLFRFYKDEIHEIGFANFGFITGRKKNDATRDLTDQKGTSELESDTLITRLKSLPSTRLELLKDVPSIGLTKRISELFDQHSKSVYTKFGLWKNVKDALDSPFMTHLIASLVTKVDGDYDIRQTNNSLVVSCVKDMYEFRYLSPDYQINNTERAAMRKLFGTDSSFLNPKIWVALLNIEHKRKMKEDYNFIRGTKVSSYRTLELNLESPLRHLRTSGLGATDNVCTETSLVLVKHKDSMLAEEKRRIPVFPVRVEEHKHVSNEMLCLDLRDDSLQTPPTVDYWINSDQGILLRSIGVNIDCIRRATPILRKALVDIWMPGLINQHFNRENNDRAQAIVNRYLDSLKN
jgi:hypothetical protein